ncbi:MAG: class I SAM-dependent methyltransferase [Caldilineae bacterium]|nr:MAG: class I SAM-dependent methyltransferase [Caldilineae bacterium]
MTPPTDASLLHEKARVADPIGYETLRRMATVARYNDWIYEEIGAFAGQRLLEVGCGIGNMTEYFVDRELVVGIDLLAASVALTLEKHRNNNHVHAFQGDITDPEFVETLRPFRFDTVLCLNVLEHIAQDALALRHMYELLVPAGRLLLFVPAGVYMFGTLDLALGHHRRYELPQLRELVCSVGFEIERLGYLNLAGIPGWWLNSRLLKRDLLPQRQLDWFNRLAPLFIRSERWLRRLWDVPLGQSLLCIARRPLPRDEKGREEGSFPA